MLDLYLTRCFLRQLIDDKASQGQVKNVFEYVFRTPRLTLDVHDYFDKVAMHTVHDKAFLKALAEGNEEGLLLWMWNKRNEVIGYMFDRLRVGQEEPTTRSVEEAA